MALAIEACKPIATAAVKSVVLRNFIEHSKRNLLLLDRRHRAQRSVNLARSFSCRFPATRTPLLLTHSI
ncbi:hypothetical protein ELY38_05230 [Vreelandella nanhaiensis]|uniref:Uncharacterized protein n=1 Tax=Vreelandella nanhaiensis TaxID=1258546 RepID=A0A3S1DTH7_9GAMM|nr:hypothetical protein ELY38_05230 [Halomonas nanhaiensis]